MTRMDNSHRPADLVHAALYITELPRAEHDAPEWQAAMEALLLFAEHDGPTMFARIGVMRALNLACFTRRSENGKSLPKTGNFFPRRTNGIP
jgi:hypothetical protein